MKNIKSERLKKLLDVTVILHCDTMDFDDDYLLYDTMYKDLLEGNLDGVFIAPKLETAFPEQKEEAFALARKYSYLCFYNPTTEDYYKNWPDAVENIAYRGYDDEEVIKAVISQRVLDNYNFLVELAYEKGEKALKEMSLFQDSEMAEESSVVDYLRNTFANDEALKMCLDETSNEFGFGSDVSKEDKELLYTYPQGVLFFEDEDKVVMNTEQNLVNSIARITNEEEIKELNTIAQASENLGEYYFYMAIRNVWDEYDENKRRGNVTLPESKLHR